MASRQMQIYPRVRALLVNLLLALFGLAVALGISEVVFTHLFTPPPETIETTEVATAEDGGMVGHQEFNRYHPLYGMNGIPNIDRTMIGSNLPVHHNSRGNRSPEVSFGHSFNTTRVLML